MRIPTQPRFLHNKFTILSCSMTDNCSLFSGEWPEKLFVTGIGTDVGKSYATGWLAKELMLAGRKVITQKFIQTGNTGSSEDIEVHRRVMGIPFTPEDLDGTTAPVIFTYPCSPDLAAEIDGREIPFDVIDRATETLLQNHDIVLIEGAGGALVPLKGDYLTADFLAERKLPAIVVTNGQLGSISHTLLTIEALSSRGIKIFAVVYNSFFDKDATICKATKCYLRDLLVRRYPETYWLEF